MFETFTVNKLGMNIFRSSVRYWVSFTHIFVAMLFVLYSLFADSKLIQAKPSFCFRLGTNILCYFGGQYPGKLGNSTQTHCIIKQVRVGIPNSLILYHMVALWWVLVFFFLWALFTHFRYL